MDDVDRTDGPNASRGFAVPLRTVMAAVLHLHPRHVKLTSANARTMRFTFSTAADGFHVGEKVTAVLEDVAAGTLVTMVGGSAAPCEAAERTMHHFLDELTAQIERDADGATAQGGPR